MTDKYECVVQNEVRLYVQRHSDSRLCSSNQILKTQITMCRWFQRMTEVFQIDKHVQERFCGVGGSGQLCPFEAPYVAHPVPRLTTFIRQ